MKMASVKTVCVYFGADLDQSSLQLNDPKINRKSSFIYRSSVVTDKGLADNVIKENIIKPERQLLKSRLILRSRALLIKGLSKCIRNIFQATPSARFIKNFPP